MSKRLSGESVLERCAHRTIDIPWVCSRAGAFFFCILEPEKQVAQMFVSVERFLFSSPKAGNGGGGGEYKYLLISISIY